MSQLDCVVPHIRSTRLHSGICEMCQQTIKPPKYRSIWMSLSKLHVIGPYSITSSIQFLRLLITNQIFLTDWILALWAKLEYLYWQWVWMHLTQHFDNNNSHKRHSTRDILNDWTAVADLRRSNEKWGAIGTAIFLNYFFHFSLGRCLSPLWSVFLLNTFDGILEHWLQLHTIRLNKSTCLCVMCWLQQTNAPKRANKLWRKINYILLCAYCRIGELWFVWRIRNGELTKIRKKMCTNQFAFKWATSCIWSRLASPLVWSVKWTGSDFYRY